MHTFHAKWPSDDEADTADVQIIAPAWADTRRLHIYVKLESETWDLRLHYGHTREFHEDIEFGDACYDVMHFLMHGTNLDTKAPVV